MAALFSHKSKLKNSFAGKIAVVCGGSKGIGKATAKEIVQRGGSVCLVARSPQPLAHTAEELKTLFSADTQFAEVIACDTTDMARLKPELDAFVERHGVPDYLLNVVGYAHPEYVRALTLDDFRRNMDVNYYGQLVPILALLPHFLTARKGHITNVSSIAGFLGVMGYAAYTPSKFALVGLSEALRNELKPHGITVSVAFPPDTDTPGFEQENLTKPPETALMSSNNAALLSAEEVAHQFVEGLLRKDFEILIGDAKWMRPASRLFPRLTRYLSDREYAKARRQMNEMKKQAD